MYKLKVKNNRGDVLTLTNNPKYTVYKIEGLTPPQATINSSVNTTTDGSKVNSTRLESRNIVIYVAIEGDVEANRINLYKYFPAKKTITLYYTNDRRDVFIEGTVELIECDLFAHKQVAQISIICPKPYFKSVESLVANFNAVNSMFTFPFSIPTSGMEFSTISRTIRKSIINAGDVETGMVIDLYATGTVVNPVIYNASKKTSLRLNITMQPSDNIVINTNTGEKSISLIRSSVITNVIGYMARNSDWFVLEAGDNVFTYSCDSGSSNLQIRFTTSLLYSGV